MKGSEKQVAWAEEIKAKKVGFVVKAIREGQVVDATVAPLVEEEFLRLMESPREAAGGAALEDASWWIDRRNNPSTDLLGGWLQEAITAAMGRYLDSLWRRSSSGLDRAR